MAFVKPRVGAAPVEIVRGATSPQVVLILSNKAHFKIGTSTTDALEATNYETPQSHVVEIPSGETDNVWIKRDPAFLGKAWYRSYTNGVTVDTIVAQ